MTPSTESPRVGGNLLMASCLLLCFGSAFLGFAGLWAPYGPSLMSALFLIAAGPVIAFGKRAKVETVGWRTLAVMSAVACGLIFSSFLNAGIMRSPQNVGEGATGGFMFFAALQMWAFLRIMRRNMPELVEGLNPQIALSAAAAAGAAGYWGVFALAIFCAFIPLAGLRVRAVVCGWWPCCRWFRGGYYRGWCWFRGCGVVAVGAGWLGFFVGVSALVGGAFTFFCHVFIHV
jgi:membrane protein